MLASFVGHFRELSEEQVFAELFSLMLPSSYVDKVLLMTNSCRGFKDVHFMLEQDGYTYGDTLKKFQLNEVTYQTRQGAFIIILFFCKSLVLFCTPCSQWNNDIPIRIFCKTMREFIICNEMLI